MGSLLWLALPLVLVLAPVVFLMVRESNHAKAAFEREVARGFSPAHVFNMWNVIVALDESRKKLCIAHLSVLAFPPERQPVELHLTQVLPSASIKCIRVRRESDINIEFVFVSTEANTFNGQPAVSFSTAIQSAAVVREMLASWPSSTTIERQGI